MAENVWTKIARLRVKDTSFLAPVVLQAVNDGIEACKGATVVIEGEEISLDVVVVETLRVQELQEIYFAQGTSKQKSVLKGMHVYGVAVDVVSARYLWFSDKASVEKWPDSKIRAKASVLWYRAVADKLMATKELAWGGLWKRFPDSPHFQSSRVPSVPNDLMISTYQKHGGGQEGREAVWKLFKLEGSP